MMVRLPSAVVGATALLFVASAAGALEISTGPRNTCRVDGRRINCALVAKCAAVEGDDIVRVRQRWWCCDTMVGATLGQLHTEPPVPLPPLARRCFDLLRDDGFPPDPYDTRGGAEPPTSLGR
jgi:hypothetical protein